MNQKNYKSKINFPQISIVVIGLNVEKFISNCLQSIFKSNFPLDHLQVIYVDSGSRDSSIEIVKKFKQVKIVELNSEHPSAAMARNAGFRATNHNIVQFVDADSYLHPDWLKNAYPHLKKEIVAVTGTLKERYPEKNVFHRMAQLEWNLHRGKNGWTTSNGIVNSFGGNVMLLKPAINETNGYDENLPAGEDPDLSFRIRQNGRKILRINTLMASHDIDLSQLKQYLKRTKRSGYAYIQLALKHWQTPERNMLQPVFRILSGVLMPVFCIVTGLALGYPVAGISAALLIAFRLLFKISGFSRILSIRKSTALQYALHLAFAIYPQFIGILHGILNVLHQKTKNFLGRPAQTLQIKPSIIVKEFL